MGFLDFLQASPLKKLEAAAEENPSPETLSALAEKHMELGEFDQALLVADRGLQTFRQATRLREIVQFVRKKQSQARLKPLRDELRVRPSPLAYSQLAFLPFLQLAISRHDEHTSLLTVVLLRPRHSTCFRNAHDK